MAFIVVDAEPVRPITYTRMQRERLVKIIDCIPEQEQVLLLEIAKRFISDDVASVDDLQAIAAARRELIDGETVSHDAINWD